METFEQLSAQPETTVVDGEERFSECLKRIRLGLKSKQMWISEVIGCSDAAVSLWETGSRIPNPRSLSRLLGALAQEGSPTSELLELRRIWFNELVRRRASRHG